MVRAIMRTAFVFFCELCEVSLGMIASWSFLQQVRPRSNEQQHPMVHEEILSFAGACTFETRLLHLQLDTPLLHNLSMEYEGRRRQGGLMCGRLS